jgi:hypothetical protein
MKLKVRDCIRRAAHGLALTLLMTPAAVTAQYDPYEIHLIQQTWTPRPGVTADAERALVEAADAARRDGRAAVHALVQLYEVPDDSQRAELERAGLILGNPLPGRAWIASVDVAQAASVAERREVRWIEPWTAARRLHPRLATGDVAPWALDREHPGWIMTMVHLHQGVDPRRGEELAARLGGVAFSPVEGLNALTVWMPESRLAELAKDEDVLWIEEGPPPLSPTNDGIRAQMKVEAVVSSPYDLDGKGVNLFVFDGARVRGSHVTFDDGNGSRVKSVDTSPFGAHATHVAGTAAGDGSGSMNGRGRGMAPLSTILSAGYNQPAGMLFWDNAGDIETDYSKARGTFGADLANNSIGSNTSWNNYPCSREGDYAATSRLVDTIVRGNDPAVTGSMLLVWANGNERGGVRCGTGYHTTAEPSCAKNPIHIGAINSDGGAMTDFSSWGPCDDGRLKPTVVAPGCESGRVTGEGFILSGTCNADPGTVGVSCSSDTLYSGTYYCGTSMASPAVTGTLALLLQDWRDHLPIQRLRGPYRMLPALVKAMVIHTARDLGTIGPDYKTGYGSVDAKALIDLERNGASTLGAAGLSVWGTGTAANGQILQYQIEVPAGVAELKASLAWDDFAAETLAAKALVNDLDLELVAPDGTAYQPWVLDPANPHLAAFSGPNHLDNQEQVVLKDPAPGTWTVRVAGTTVLQGPQSFGLVYTAVARQYDEAACTGNASGFEADEDGWTLTNASRVASPAPGHGAFSVQLAGTTSTVAYEASRTFTLPAQQSAAVTFALYTATTEVPTYHAFDTFTVEVRDAANAVLAVLDYHNAGETAGAWLPQRLDLTPWAGKTIQLVFRARTNAAKPTTFWIDDVQVSTCPTAAAAVRAYFFSNGGQDGYVQESSENSGVGGFAQARNVDVLHGFYGLPIGDTDENEQVKGVFSFDTSALPDTATIVSARLILTRKSLSGTNPFDTHGVCRVDIRTGAFNNNAALETNDFEASSTRSPVSLVSKPVVDGDTSYASLNGEGLAAINKAGITQFRLAFSNGDDDDFSRDLLYFVSGEGPEGRELPKLEVVYLP